MKTRMKMREQAANERIKNFNEVALGYNEEEAVEEAARCLQCKTAPCKHGCPAQVLIPEFILKIKEKDFAKAYEILKEKNNLPAVCGRVCPQETQCEEKCVLGKKGEPIAIGRLERFAADYGIKNKLDKAEKTGNGKKVAVVGGGPAGITCAADLAKLGHEVHLFEALHKPGGVMIYGIPEFRLPKSIVGYEIDSIEKLGVKIYPNALFGKDRNLKDLKEQGFDALFIGSGAGLPRYMNLEGEELNSCYSANEFLTRINLLKAYEFPRFKTPVYTGKKTIVVGGGNVAMDAARCAKRLGAEVAVIYRRTEKEMPARVEEVHHAKEEGIEFNFLCNPVKYIGDENGYVKKAVIEKMKLGEPDKSGRRRPVATGEFFEIEADSVVVAIGNKPNPLIPQSISELKTTDWGTIEVGEDFMTSVEGIFAGGDITTGAATVIEAIGAGKQAASSIDEFLKNGKSL
ncbi:MAG: glutamate synthase (NADPH), homotetrameric [Candidatus Muiribacterium halophilum]|uniref:Glutamate synthase (NADPH), homotetrameric n=1 Tax=Muiribacterium halophilum TaxID=2053465 RepID=A0A2N5ZD87_MUIH1|nr:MAG: glutamate synthase (NADPH), homotetrameric [Candidatus Muirbacterium halophilum]